ncbi:MAG: hypothetical protein Q4C46_00265 [Bacillota bacterium]|nr:hypothetical protein [Bacillota bacterium]
MNKRSKQFPFVNIGLSSLLVVFLVLCLTTFALLSLSSAKSDLALSQKLADHRNSYYTASSSAESVLSQLDMLMEESYRNPAGSYIDSVRKGLDKITDADVSLDTESAPSGSLAVISYLIPLDKTQALDVRLLVTDPSVSESYYNIEKWQVITTTDRKFDQSLDLMNLRTRSIK